VKTLLALAPLVVVACSACGDDSNAVDAAIDGPPDPCAPKMSFTGEFVTWDSSLTMFMGIPGATFRHRTDTAVSDTTAPNGRFDEMCIPPEDGFVDVTPGSGSLYIGGTVVIEKDVYSLLPPLTFRSFTEARGADFGFDAQLAHVYVHVVGGARGVESSATAGVQQQFDGTTWTSGNTGTDVYLGNIAPGMTTLTVTGGSAIGAGTIPLTAGQLTFVTLIAR
jgi:hypothetical protein